MKLPLHFTLPGGYDPTAHIKICDATNRVVCTVPRDEWRLADLIIRKINKQQPLWHRLFGLPRDARQRAYDRWIGERSET